MLQIILRIVFIPRKDRNSSQCFTPFILLGIMPINAQCQKYQTNETVQVKIL